jgi:hypothetical protein
MVQGSAHRGSFVVDVTERMLRISILRVALLEWVKRPSTRRIPPARKGISSFLRTQLRAAARGDDRGSRSLMSGRGSGSLRRDGGQFGCDELISLGGRVLIPHRRLRRRMSQTAHQLGNRGACLGGQDGAGVPQVMDAKVRPPSGNACTFEVPVERRVGRNLSADSSPFTTRGSDSPSNRLPTPSRPRTRPPLAPIPFS